MFFGTVIENASNEQVNRGNDKKPDWGPKYHMDELLDPAFRLPKPLTKEEREAQAFEQFKQQIGVRKA